MSEDKKNLNLKAPLVPDQNNEKDIEANMSLIDHLSELRIRLTYSAYFILAGVLLCWAFSEHLFNFVRKPIEPFLPQGGLVFTNPVDKFMAHLKLAFVAGIILSAPFWLYQLWKFISPALYRNEKKMATGFIFFGTLQFLMGVAFSYFVVLPMAFKFLMSFGGDTDKPMITIDHYMGFFTQTSLVFGLTFELPVIISFLGMMGLVSKKFLAEKRRYAIAGITIVSGIVAPPDILSMILLMIPLILMYEISIIIVGLFQKQESTANLI